MIRGTVAAITAASFVLGFAQTVAPPRQSTAAPVTATSLILSPDGLTVYDPIQNITWLANFNLAATNRFGMPACKGPGQTGCVNPSGSMHWDAAVSWIAAMNAASYLGQSNWQFPTTPNVDRDCAHVGPDGNSFGFGCTASAFANLYNNGLGLQSPATAVPIPANTVGAFNNFQPYLYWTSGDAGTKGSSTISFNSGFAGANTNPNFLYVIPMISGKITGAPAGSTVYDATANVTWLANANLAATNTFGVPACANPTTPTLCIAPDGAMSWDSANQWITNMNAAAYLGQKTWKLPPGDPACSGYACSSTKSPLAELYYGVLKLTGGTPVIPQLTTTVGPFTNIQPYLYWSCPGDTIQSPCSSTPPAPNFEWTYSLGNGFTGTDVLDNTFYVVPYFVGAPAWYLASQPVSITTAAQLPAASVGTPYSQTLAASGGAPPYAWSLASGTLPAGLGLASNGAISGTPTAAGTSSFTLQVTDSNSAAATLAAALVVQPAPSSLSLTNGIYLGVWADPGSAKNQESAIEALEGPAPNGIGRVFDLHLVYLPWNGIASQLDSNGVFQPNQALAGDIAHGRVPVISWNCDPNVANSNHVIAGGNAAQDALITASALALKQYPGPVILRWFWEFNVLANNQSCRGDTGGKPTQQVYNDFIGAWQHIRTLFQQAGAANVVFLWNPGNYNAGGNDDPHGFYPGNQYVDWIGIDTYQKAAADTFSTNFDQFYNDFSISQYGNKPLMVGENGAQNYSINKREMQAPYLQGLLASIQAGKYPLLAAYDYFDAPGNAPFNWVLDDNNGKGGGGLAELAVLGGSSLFAPPPLPPGSSPPLSITTSAQLPVGTVAVSYTLTLSAAGGAPPFSWSIAAGSLPAGLALTSDGSIAGIPTAAGTASFTVQVTDSNSAQATLAMTLVVQPPPPVIITFYVAPNGNDSWSGTLPAPNSAGTDGPLATFDSARMAVQSVNTANVAQVTVQFRAGTYYLPATLHFTAADSGSASTPIVYQNYPGENPLFSGGMQVQNWTNVSGNLWTTTLPPSTQYFENLFYNGVRRLRPRLGGYLGTYFRNVGPIYLQSAAPPAQAPNPNCSVYFAGQGWACYDRFQYDPKDPIVSTWKNLSPPKGNPCNQPTGSGAPSGDIELVDFEKYYVSKLRVSCVDTAQHIVYLTGATGTEIDHPGVTGFIPNHRYLIENLKDSFSQPGQWFLDRSTAPWTLQYLANPGENPNNDTVIVPQTPQLMVASNLQYVTFQGLGFAHDNYTMPAAGYNGQADLVPAISFQNSQYITFDSNTVSQTSGAAVDFISCVDKSSRSWCTVHSTAAVNAHHLIQNSAFYDLASDAIRIGSPGQASDTNDNVAQFNTVQNNVVEGYGRVFPSSKGIKLGQGHDNLVTHNEVYDGYKGAIALCYCADTDSNPPFTNNNTVSFNLVYNLFQGITNDSGSIYFGVGTPSPPSSGHGNMMLNNVVHDVSDASALDSDGYGGDGLYIDDFTGNAIVENNLVYRVSGNAVSFSGPRAGPNQSSTVKNNIFAFARQSMLNAYNPYSFNVMPPLPMFFTGSNNIFYFDRTESQSFYLQGGCTYAGAIAYTAYQQWTSNLYWRVDGGFATDTQAFHVQQSLDANGGCGNNKLWKYYTLAGWQALGEDAQSVIKDPGFKNPAYPADDYSLPKGSPGAGFVVFDYTQAGRSNPVIMPPPVPPAFPTKPFNPAKDF